MILIIGVSYGLSTVCKLLIAGYNVKIICTKEEAEILNKDGFTIQTTSILK